MTSITRYFNTKAAFETTAIIVVDHGSRRQASNEMLEQAARNFAVQSGYVIVEPAHMELAQPDIATAFRRCVARGADRVVVFPYFLSPGRHWTEDIPHLVASAAAEFTQVSWLVTAPFALHPGMLQIMNERIQHCLHVAEGIREQNACDACAGTFGCRLASGSTTAASGPCE